VTELTKSTEPSEASESTDLTPNQRSGVRPVITGQGTSVPQAFDQATVWEQFFKPRMSENRIAQALFLKCGITTRHGVVDPLQEDVSDWTTGQRMRRYLPEARALGREAITRALSDAGLRADEVGQLVVVSCTGYATPGLDILLADDLGMPTSVQRLIIGHMGCYAAVPALGTAADFVRANARPAVVLCVELTSLHVQPAQEHEEIQQVVAHALFADAATAFVIEPDAPAGLEVLQTAAVTAPGTAPLMSWDVTDHGFRMGLSPKVPDVLSVHVADAMVDLLKPHRLEVADIGRWAVHPGGPRILDVIGERLQLPAGSFDVSRKVLDENGNCSSGTVMMVLQETRRQRTPEPGETLVAMAFGPGLTLYSALLRAV
jgi:predicted naringenin-chalcone synthase